MANIETIKSTSTQPVQQLGFSGLSQTSQKNTVGTNGGNTLPPVAEKTENTSLPTAKELDSIAETLSQFSKSFDRDLAFSVDDSTGITVITVTDHNSGEVVRQIPSEDILQLAQNLQELQEELQSSQGNLFDTRV